MSFTVKSQRGSRRGARSEKQDIKQEVSKAISSVFPLPIPACRRKAYWPDVYASSREIVCLLKVTFF